MNSNKSKISQMTISEKAGLVHGASFFGSSEYPKLGIRRLQFLDGGTGINFEQLFGDFCSGENAAEMPESAKDGLALFNVINNYYCTENLNESELELRNAIKERLDRITGMPDMSPGCFPPGILLAATFSPETVYETGEALGAEAEVYGIDVLLGTPNVNIHRDPLGGRVFEGYSEDPYLVSSLAPELIKGVQKYPVAANVKHFAANNQETNRVGLNVVVSRRALEEIYLPGFEACVKKAGVKTVMSAYNKINGVPCTENKTLLRDKLRNSWKFDGLTLSDWGAVRNSIESVEAGNNLSMPGPASDLSSYVTAVKEGIVSQDNLNEAVLNILDLIDYIDSKKKGYKRKFRNAEELKKITDAAAYRAAAEGIVLLKNERNLFPFSSEGKEKIIVTGTGCENLITCGEGSACVITDRNTSFSEELIKILGEERVSICSSVSGKISGKGEIYVVVASLSGSEGHDRTDLKLDKHDKAVLRELILEKQQGKNIRIALILNVCGPVTLSEYEPYADGIFCMFLPGMQGGKAMADIITGKVNPSGKLPVTFPAHYRDTPTFINFPGDGSEVVYGEGIFTGYRYYDYKKIKPAYSFGYGLSYTTFEISDVKTSSERFSDKLTVSGRIRNTGTADGAEVVQIYVSDVYSTAPKPPSELKAFKKIYLKAGESKKFQFVLDESAFSYYDSDYGRFICEEGYYDIIVAVSVRSDDVNAIKRVYREGVSPYSYGLNSTIKVFFENPILRDILLHFWENENYDRGILESNYKYTPDKKLYEIFPKIVDSDTETNIHLEKFLEEISKIEKR